MSIKHQSHLKGKFWEDRKIEHSIEFVSGEEFGGMDEAIHHLEQLGYKTGTALSNDPIGFVYEANHVFMWQNLTDEDKAKLDGVILPNKDFKYDSSLVIFFNPPKY
jgi:hypothetical protein